MTDQDPIRGSRENRLIKPGRVASKGRPRTGNRRSSVAGSRGRLLFYGLPALTFLVIVTLFVVAVASSKQVHVTLQDYGELDQPGGLIDRDHPIPLETGATGATDLPVLPSDPGPEETEPAPTVVIIIDEDPVEQTEPAGEEEPTTLIYVISEKAGIYPAPDQATERLATVGRDEILILVEEGDEWTQVRWKKEVEGFIRSREVSRTPLFTPKADGVYYVQNRQVYVREGPGTGHPIAGFALRGMTIRVLEAGDEWSRIRTEHGLNGFMRNDLFGPDKPADEITELETGRYMYVDTDVANLREEPSTESEIIGAAFMDDRIFQISDNGGWSKVRTEGGVIAYMFNHLLRDTPPANPFVKTNRTLYVATGSVNVRSSPTTGSSVLGRVSQDQAVKELEANDTWSKVKLNNGTVGFIRSDLLTNITPPPEGFSKTSGTVYVTTGAANVRSEPNTSCAIMAVVRYGEKLTRKATGPGWTMIQTADGKTGYISNDLISTKEPASSSPPAGGGSQNTGGSQGSGESSQQPAPSPSETSPPPGDSGGSDMRQRVVEIARSALGVPYRYSGRTMSAFDCSGLVKYVFEAIGYRNIPHGADPQARQLGTRIDVSGKDYSRLLPGDLLFFSRGSGYHHVGIYIGNNQMIHASSTHGRVVVTDLQNYVAAARANRVID